MASAANMLVRFADGTIMFGIYNSTSDVPLPFLAFSPDDAWAIYENGQFVWPPRAAAPPTAEAVEVWVQYGGGFRGTCLATRATLFSPTDSEGTSRFTDESAGTPAWVPQEFL